MASSATVTSPGVPKTVVVVRNDSTCSPAASEGSATSGAPGGVDDREVRHQGGQSWIARRVVLVTDAGHDRGLPLLAVDDAGGQSARVQAGRTTLTGGSSRSAGRSGAPAARRRCH